MFSTFLEWVVKQEAGWPSVLYYMDDFLFIGQAGIRCVQFCFTARGGGEFWCTISLFVGLFWAFGISQLVANSLRIVGGILHSDVQLLPMMVRCCLRTSRTDQEGKLLG